MVWRNKGGGGGYNRRPLDLGQQQQIKSSKVNQIGTEYSVYLASVQGVGTPPPYCAHDFGTRRPVNNKKKKVHILLSSAIVFPGLLAGET